jgi:hypothetical protein
MVAKPPRRPASGHATAISSNLDEAVSQKSIADYRNLIFFVKMSYHAQRILHFVIFGISIAFSASLYGIRDEENQGRWEKPCASGPDAVVPGFLVNMGPTGARGILQERAYVVKYIFEDSPADGVLELDDEVYGANGKTFAQHTFGRKVHGIEGPLQDLGLAIEDSEGTDGVLSLMVRRAGESKVVAVQLEKLGRFSDTFPRDCKKTRILLDRAYKYLIEHPGGLDSQGRAAAALALLSSDDPEVFAAGKQMALDWNKPYDNDTWSWHLSFQGMTLAEYYLRTKDSTVLETLDDSLKLLRRAQWQPPIHHWKSKQIKNIDQAILDKHQALYDGGMGHAPYPFIVARGGGGYGPMQLPTCLAILSWQLGKQCGLEAQQEGLDAGFRFLEHGTTQSGRIAYGGEFTLNNGPIDWVEWQKDTKHMFTQKSGLAHLVYQMSPERENAAEMQRRHAGNIMAAYRDMSDGHACAMMGLAWAWAGIAASENEALQQEVFNYYKAWINLARCHGSDSYVILPARDYADSSYYRKNIRNHTTASVALLYSFSSPNLQLQGAEKAVAAPKVVAK